MMANLNRIVQLVPWRDRILALTVDGQIYWLVPEESHTKPFVAVLAFPGLPRRED